MRLLERVIKASPERPTRLHDLRGRIIDFASLPAIPRAVLDTTALVAFGYRRPVPWISYRATRDLSRIIGEHWRILEFGAGMSTLWFARRAEVVVSIEGNHDWYERIRTALLRERVTNVQLEYRASDCLTYSSLSRIGGGAFDLALVDGDCRDACMLSCLKRVRPGGYVYLDNTDQPGDRRKAEQILLSAPLEWHKYYNDFAPGLVAITQGLLARLRS